MSAPVCRLCGGDGFRFDTYNPAGPLRPCLACNSPEGHRDPGVVPVGLRELYSRIRSVQSTLRVAKSQAHGVARENVSHALRAVDALVVDLEVYGVPS